MQGGISWACVQYAVVPPYVCVKPAPPYVGVYVAYWQPVLVIETSKRPGDSVISSAVPGMSSILTKCYTIINVKCDRGFLSPMSSGSSRNADDTNTQMNEAHVIGFPWEAAFDCNGSFTMSNFNRG